MSEPSGYSPPSPEDDVRGLVSAVVVVLLLVVLPVCLSAWGAVRLWRWAGSPAHGATPRRRAAARLLGVVVWGAVAAGAVSLARS